MYLLLLVVGGALSAAGIALAATGVSVHDRTFDTTIVTPSVITVVGGFLLIGLGLVLRVLQRIEQTFASGQVVSAESAEPSAVSADEKRAENLPEQARTAVRRETAHAVEGAELSSSTAANSPPPTSVDLAVAEAKKARTAKLIPRLEMNLRAPSPSGRPAGLSFDAPWPKGPRPTRAAPAVPGQAAGVAAAELETSVASAAAAVQAPAPGAAAPSPEPVSALKSGVVNGMAYTLYSDGSIEAQLPQGTLRFCSITELRNHIEQSA